MSISHDNYHKKFIKTSYIKNLLRVCADLDMPASITMIKVKNEKLGSLIDELNESLYTPTIQFGQCLPVGGALKTFSSAQFNRTVSSDKLTCAYGGNISILYDGSIYPCCSQSVVDTGLKIGNFNELSLKESLVKIKNNALLYLMRNTDLQQLIGIAKNDLNIDIPNNVVNSCELCKCLFNYENIKLLHPHIILLINKTITERV